MTTITNKKLFAFALSIFLSLLISVILTRPINADQSPVGCTGSGLQISLYSSLTEAHNGDIISFGVKVYNGLNQGPIVCDASDIQASIITPDNETHPITLLRTTLTNGQQDMYQNVVSYTARAEDVKTGNIFAATASDTGVIHQNDTNSQGGANEGLNITYLKDTIGISTTTPTTTPVATPGGGGGGGGGSGGGGGWSYIPLTAKISIEKVPNPSVLPIGSSTVLYTYTVWNSGTIQDLINISVTDDKCSPVTFLSGDINNNNKLDLNEKWKYGCTTNLSTTTTNIATSTGQGDDIYHQTVIATTTATVIVHEALPLVYATAMLSLPLTGFAPNDQVQGPTLDNVRPSNGSRIKIPNIHVDAPILSVGLTDQGAIDVPQGPSDTAWFNQGPYPGEIGNAIIVGHYGWKNGISAVFDKLHKIQKGEQIHLKDRSGLPLTFVVTKVETYDQHANTSSIFKSNDQEAHLILITCGGVWNKITKTYSERTVVFADKV